MIRRPPRSTQSRSSAASDVYKRQGENHEVGPGDLVPVFLLDRPKQPARLVEIAVVRPAVQRCETLRAGPGAAAAIAGAVGARAVPRHADEESAVMSIVGRPPVLAV